MASRGDAEGAENQPCAAFSASPREARQFTRRVDSSAAAPEGEQAKRPRPRPLARAPAATPFSPRADAAQTFALPITDAGH